MTLTQRASRYPSYLTSWSQSGPRQIWWEGKTQRCWAWWRKNFGHYFKIGTPIEVRESKTSHLTLKIIPKSVTKGEAGVEDQ